MSHERRVNANPNPQLTCFCGASRGDCPGGPGFVSPNEIENELQGSYANFISDACIVRLAGRTGDEALAASADPTPGATYTGPEADPDTGQWLAPWAPGHAPASYDNPHTLHREADTPSSALVGVTGGQPDEPERHVNPVGDSLEEATDLLEQQDLDRLEDNGGPVI